jgi:type I restriction enzyme S subunit
MITDLKPYPEYKESDLPWLQRYPADWVIKRGKAYLFCVDERSENGKEELLTVSSARGVIPRRSAKVTMFKAESYAGHKLCWPGDLVINSLWAWGGGLGVSQHHGIISTAYSVYRSRPSAQINPRYLHELVRSSAFHWELQVRSKGVWISRLQLTDTSFLDAPIPLPPPAEQAAIVRFLDHWNGRLEKAIRSKRRVIALLQEQKQAIIHRAVTLGLDPKVQLKDSEVPWLGGIPEHWDVRPLKYLSRRVQNGATPPSDSPEYFANGTIPWYGPASISSAVHVGVPSKLINQVAVRDGKVRLMRAPTLLVVVIGTVGKIALLQADGATNQQITAFELLENRVLPEFLTLQIKIAEPWLHASASSSTIPILDSVLLKRVPIAAPALEEQQEILEFISGETAPLTTAIARYEREITLLREYRTRLTADVVTGKLDVRPAAAQVPDSEDASIPDEAENFEEESELGG